MKTMMVIDFVKKKSSAGRLSRTLSGSRKKIVALNIARQQGDQALFSIIQL
jgi:hypothetical protein